MIFLENKYIYELHIKPFHLDKFARKIKSDTGKKWDVGNIKGISITMPRQNRMKLSSKLAIPSLVVS